MQLLDVSSAVRHIYIYIYVIRQLKVKEAEHMKVIWSKIRLCGRSCNTNNCIEHRLPSTLCTPGTDVM